jgi:Xaa-Pro aminopeptidase
LSYELEDTIDDQPIAASEFAERCRRVQAFLTENELGALMVYSPAHEHKWGQTGHVAYLSGWANCDRIVDTVVVVPQQGEPVLLVAGMDFMFEQAAEVSPITDMLLAAAVDPNAIAGQTLEIIEANGIGSQDVGIVGVESMPVPLNDTNETKLQAGTTAVVHSVFGLPGGKIFVPLGDLCHVTEDGPELLMDFQHTPFVAG